MVRPKICITFKWLYEQKALLLKAQYHIMVHGTLETKVNWQISYQIC